MELGIQGKTAAVAAASGGLGRAIAEELAREGANVAICSRDATRIEQAASEITRETEAEVLAIAADVSKGTEASRFVQEATQRFGGVDILVTNAGGPSPGGFDDFDDSAWQKAFELNLLSTVRMIREALPQMQERNWGRIIVLTSTSVKAPIPNLILSNSIRAGVLGMAKSLSSEVAQFNITVNNICPGRIDTNRVRSLDESTAKRSGRSPEDVRRERESQIPMRRYGSPEELAYLATFLASEKASYITGTSIQVDGGALGNLF